MSFNKATDLPALKAHLSANLARYPAAEEPANVSRLLNDSTFSTVVPRQGIEGPELQKAVVGSEFLPLTASQRDLWKSLIAAAPIDMSDLNIQAQVDEVWAGGTTTRTNIRGLRVKTGSDLELQFGEGSRCSHRDVSAARALP